MNIFISGATSAIAQAWARLRAAQGAGFYLLGRDQDKLEAVKNDLMARGAREVHLHVLDLSVVQDYDDIIAELFQCWPTIDIALFAQGSLPDQRELEKKVDCVRGMFELNAMSYILPASLIAERMAVAGGGSVVLISSVAGDRGRQSNYFYGTSKAAVTTFAQGLRNHVAKHGVQVLTVKPGFVDTPMTASIPKGGPLWATPQQIAASIEYGIKKKRNVIYAPWFWRLIMLVIRHIPEMIFKKMSL
ncbi:MAG TPA: SDR family oxidoreductase [Pseudomonadales bacterium]|nr:SDR family oxidoreductase [Pseudomonadales bacterium]